MRASSGASRLHRRAAPPRGKRVGDDQVETRVTPANTVPYVGLPAYLAQRAKKKRGRGEGRGRGEREGRTEGVNQGERMPEPKAIYIVDPVMVVDGGIGTTLWLRTRTSQPVDGWKGMRSGEERPVVQ